MLRMAERLHLILRSERSERLEGRSPRGIGSGSLGAVPQAPALRPGEGRLLPRGFAAAGASPSGSLRARPELGTLPALGAGNARTVGGMEGMVLHDRDRAARQLLDVLEIGTLRAVAEGDGDAVGTGPGGAPDPVDIALRHVRNLVVDHVADAVDVDAAGCDIGRDEHARGPGAEVLEGALARRLRLVAVDGVRPDPDAVQLPG